MNGKKTHWLRRHFGLGLTPDGFLVRAALVAVFFAVCHLAGWRENTTFLSGTPASADTGVNSSAVLGVIYMAGYFGFVLLTPIFVIAAGILFALERCAVHRTMKP